MTLHQVDWALIIGYFLFVLFVGLFLARRVGKSTTSFFLSDRNMPWYLLGISMVATTFSADTPNLVTEIVRENGVSGNWVWWVFLLTGMLTVFVFAKLWRRSNILTDLEFYPMRYEGPVSGFLRTFRALYLGVFFNIVIMASVCIAAIKIGGALFGLPPIHTIWLASLITVIYASLGGLKGVIITDFVQFFLALIGSIWAAVYLVQLPEVGGLTSMFSQEVIVERTAFIPSFSQTDAVIALLVIPFLFQWWSVWYPGSEPGGGGYVAQRMLAAKDEKHATLATLLFNVTHYAIRPWPWILIALASLLIFPMDTPDERQAAKTTLQSEEWVNWSDQIAESPETVPLEIQNNLRSLQFQEKGLSSLRNAFPEEELPDDKIGQDLAYPAMLRYLPIGLMGLVIASLIAAFMSTISTHLNWGASYVVNDWYKTQVKPKASERELVLVGRITTVVLMFLAALIALALSSALQAFQLLLQIGAGTGLLFILRWFWWRINAYSELAAMIISFVVALFFELLYPQLGFSPLSAETKLISGVLITTFGWILITFLTPPTDTQKLISFFQKVNPPAWGWKKVIQSAQEQGISLPPTSTYGQLPREILMMITGTLMVYSLLFTVGYLLYGHMGGALAGGLITLGTATLLFFLWRGWKIFSEV